MRQITVIVERDAESGWLVGEVKELPGCFTEAPEMPTLRANLWEAITGYLKVAEPDAPERHLDLRVQDDHRLLRR